jgi:hypothetical protein
MYLEFGKLMIVLAASALAVSILVTPGSSFSVDVVLLKKLLLYLVLIASGFAIFITFKRPPGV